MNRLRVSIVLLLILLSFQGWLGDYVNLFAVFPSGTVDISFSGFSKALTDAGIMEVIHGSLGFLILGTSLVVLVISLRSKATKVKVASVLGLSAVLSALIGGVLFVFSGFSDNGSSAQMGGSFIAAYAFFFIELYYTK